MTIELAPPAVQTSLATPTHARFCDTVFAQPMNRAVTHVGYGPTDGIEQRSHEELSLLFMQSAPRASVRDYGDE